MMWSCFDRFLPDIVPNNVIEEYPVRPGDHLLFCTDGLSDFFTPEEMFEALERDSVQAAIQTLLPMARDKALESHSFHDDITAIAIKIH